jgi:hypothetical protein
MAQGATEAAQRYNWMLASQRRVMERFGGPLPGAMEGRLGGFLIGTKAKLALTTALEESAKRFGPLMAQLGITDPGRGTLNLVGAVRQAVGAERTEVIYRQTRFGAQAGVRVHGLIDVAGQMVSGGRGKNIFEDIWLETQHGPYVISHAHNEIGASLKAAGLVNEREYTQALADSFVKEIAGKQRTGRAVRRVLNEQAAQMPAVLQAASGLQTDYLAAHQNYSPKFIEAFMAMNERGQPHEGVPFGRHGLPEPRKGFARMQRALREALTAGEIGISQIFMGKPEAMMKGRFPTGHIRDVLPFWMFMGKKRWAKPGLYQAMPWKWMPVAAGAAEAFESAWTGRNALVPRLTTPHLREAERRMGGMLSAPMARIGVADPGSKFAQMLGGQIAGTSEAVLISEEMAKRLRFVRPGAEGMPMALGRTAEQIGVGTGLYVPGLGKLNVARVVPAKQLGGLHMVVAGDILRNEAEALQTMLGDVLARSVVESRGRLTPEIMSAVEQAGFGRIERAGAHIVYHANEGRLREMGFGEAWRKLRRLGTEHTRGGLLEQVQVPGIGAVSTFVGQVGVRLGRNAPARGALKVNPTDIMTAMTMDPATREIGQQMLARAKKLGGPRAQGLLAFLNPFMGRNLPETVGGIATKYRTLRPLQIAETFGQDLSRISSQDAIRRFLAQATRGPGGAKLGAAARAPLRGPVILDLPGAISVPSPEIFLNAPNWAAPGVWDELRQAGTPTRKLALPSVQELFNLVEPLQREALYSEVAAEAYGRVPKLFQSYGRVVEAAQSFEATAAKFGIASEQALAARSGLETALFLGEESFLSQFLSHTGKDRLVSGALLPAIGGREGFRGVYATIQQHISQLADAPADKLGFALSKQVAERELGITAKFAHEQLGLDIQQIRALRTGEAQFVEQTVFDKTTRKWLKRKRWFDPEMFVGGQFYPSVVPETSGIFRLRIVDPTGPGSHNVIYTNVADRLAAFRDLDWDAMRMFIFGEGFAQDELQRAWQLQQGRVQRIHGYLKQAIDAGDVPIPTSGLEAALQPLSEEGARWRKHIQDVVGKQGGLSAKEMDFLFGDEGALSQGVLGGLFGQKLKTPLFDPKMRLWQQQAEVLFGVEAGNVVGVAGQVAAIKKGRGEIDTFFAEVERVGQMFKKSQQAGQMRQHAEYDKAVKAIRDQLQGLWKEGRVSDILLGFSSKEYTDAAQKLIEVSASAANLSGDEQAILINLHKEKLNRMATGEAMTHAELGKNLGALTAEGKPVRGGVIQNFFADIMGFGPAGAHPTGDRWLKYGKPAYDATEEALSAANAAMQSQGAAGKAAGGTLEKAAKFWDDMPGGARTAITGIGAAIGTLLTLRILKSHLFGDEPSMPPGMRIPPEMAMRAAMGPEYTGAPLPPQPMIGSGLHTGMGRPIVPFSPPTARVMAPTARQPRIHVTADDPQDLNLSEIGRSLSQATAMVSGPSVTGVFTAGGGGASGTIDLKLAADQHVGNRLYG